MSAREELTKHYGGESEHWHGLLDAYRAEVQRELVFKMRRQLAAGLKMPGYARVVVLGGKWEPMGTTHILDAWDPDRDGTMRPAAEALEELRGLGWLAPKPTPPGT